MKDGMGGACANERTKRYTYSFQKNIDGCSRALEQNKSPVTWSEVAFPVNFCYDPSLLQKQTEGRVRETYLALGRVEIRDEIRRRRIPDYVTYQEVFSSCVSVIDLIDTDISLQNGGL
jgi:hypothetical protein